MMVEHYTIKAAVYAILVKDGQVLLVRRSNTGWHDGDYGLPAGHLEAGETIVAGTIREAREETGLELVPESVTFVHVMHRRGKYIDFFFTASWSGEPQNMEPNKHDDVRWFPLDTLPENMIPSVRLALDYYQKGVTFSELDPSYDDQR